MVMLRVTRPFLNWFIEFYIQHSPDSRFLCSGVADMTLPLLMMSQIVLYPTYIRVVGIMRLAFLLLMCHWLDMHGKDQWRYG